MDRLKKLSQMESPPNELRFKLEALKDQRAILRFDKPTDFIYDIKKLINIGRQS